MPSEEAARYFGIVAGRVPSTSISITHDSPDGFNKAVQAGLRALRHLEFGEFSYRAPNWALRGTARDQAIYDQARKVIGDFGERDDWNIVLKITPPIDICRENVSVFTAENAILFNAGSARLTDRSGTSVANLATMMNFCPNAIVHVEGHTDSDGQDHLNLALSVARAEAVVAELIDNGVGVERLYAIGYGESVPIAENNTRAGKTANRRIVFTILESSE